MRQQTISELDAPKFMQTISTNSGIFVKMTLCITAEMYEYMQHKVGNDKGWKAELFCNNGKFYYQLHKMFNYGTFKSMKSIILEATEYHKKMMIICRLVKISLLKREMKEIMPL